MSKVIFQAVKSDSGIVAFDLDKSSDYRDVIDAFKLIAEYTSTNEIYKNLYDVALNELMNEKIDEIKVFLENMQESAEQFRKEHELS